MIDYTQAKQELTQLLQLIGDAKTTLLDAQKQLIRITPKEQRQFEEEKIEFETYKAKAELEISQKREALNEYIANNEGMRALILIANEKAKGFPTLARAYSDYFKLQDERITEFLVTKTHPAPGAAETVRQISKERREAEEAALLSRNTLDYCRFLAPWLDEYIGIESNELDELISNIHSSWQQKEVDLDEETRRHFGSLKYDLLSESERMQKRLDWYWNKPDKPDWQLGRDYERYIGYTYELDGWNVQYHGIKGFDDLGRDLICKRDGITEIIQCKRWAQGKEIHEKHMYYLFGTAVEYYLENRSSNNLQLDLFESNTFRKCVIPKLITTADVSQRAEQVGVLLGIAVKRQAFQNYPSIKCNVSQVDGEKIYHLPFDQQYNTTQIDNEKLEYFVSTIDEAEKLGFRHAYRWKGI